ncbi:hypothetical protein OKW28_005675 [Paraburkholderia sp. 40]
MSGEYTWRRVLRASAKPALTASSICASFGRASRWPSTGGAALGQRGCCWPVYQFM